MGGTGTGKTTFLNLLAHSRYPVGDGLESCTNCPQPHQFDFEDRAVTLIDMPGFDDANKSDADILQMIADFFTAEWLSGIMYFHRISDVKMGGASKRNFTMFKKLCGEDAFENVAIVTTRWDEEDKAVGEARLAELRAKPQLYKSVLDGGVEIFQHDRSYTSALAILHHLLGKTPKSLLIQREMADEGKKLSETTAGQELEHEILEQVVRHHRELTGVLEEMTQIRDRRIVEFSENKWFTGRLKPGN
ncbi:P-loop containing nucleoside triphosphate hydrolase protein [Mycena leptocephala]|nr:P-loop containing nucleoside triphosphate hydrolase protein [Mycena leptocephala]